MENYIEQKDRTKFLVQNHRHMSKRERRLPKRFADNIEVNLFSKDITKSVYDNTVKEETNSINDIVLSEPVAALRTGDGTSLAEIVEVDTVKVPSSSPISFTSHTFRPKIRFVCEFCNKITTKQNDFLKHVQTHHSCKLNCNDCAHLFRNKVHLEQHQILTNHNESVVTDYCSLGTSNNLITQKKSTSNKNTKELYNDHSSVTSAPAINIIVGTNGQIQSIDTKLNPASSNNHKYETRQERKESLLLHNGSISDLKFTCLKCLKEFDCHAAVRRHNKQSHTEERNFKCQECTATFKHKNNFDYHMAKHTNRKPFKCEQCSKAFTLNYELVIHMRTHTGEQPYSCDICGKPFRHRCNLIVHQRLHSGIKPYKCDVCDATFNSSSHLKKHKEFHLSEAQKKADIKYQKDYIIKPKLVDAKEFFRIHNETHYSSKIQQNNIISNAQSENCKDLSDDSPHDSKPISNTVQILSVDIISTSSETNLNEITFTNPSDTKTVDNTINAEFNFIYKFQCPICFRYFKQKCALTRHQRTHTGEKPYNCAWCNKAFSDPSNFKKHKITHIRDALSTDKTLEYKNRNVINSPIVSVSVHTDLSESNDFAVVPSSTNGKKGNTSYCTDYEIDDDILNKLTTTKGPLIIWPDFKSNELQPATLTEIEKNKQTLLKNVHNFQDVNYTTCTKPNNAAAAIDYQDKQFQLLTISYHDDID